MSSLQQIQMRWIISMLRRFRKDRKSIEGQGLVEFALLLPVFLMLVMGVIDIARAFSNLQVITNAVSRSPAGI